MIRIGQWERGLVFWPAQQPNLRVYLWFYEWHLFDAVCPGEHTGGYWIPVKTIGPDHRAARLSHPGLSLSAAAATDGAHLTLSVTNESDHDWPAVAGIIPCFNPGGSQSHRAVPPTSQFFDDDHARTWFPGPNGLEPLVRRDIHFNAELRPQVDARTTNGRFVFSEKWPTSEQNASSGLILRESADSRWVAGIAWEDFVSVQGHNPWRCMHLSVRVGPLSPGQSRAVRGRIYFFQGDRTACYARFRREFPTPAQP